MLQSVMRRLDAIEDILRFVHHEMHTLIERVDIMASALESLQAAVAAEDTVIDSAVTLIQGFAAALAAAGTDPAALAALKTDIDAKAQSLAAAVAANTPAAPAPAKAS